MKVESKNNFWKGEKKKTTTAEKKGQKTVFKNSQRATKTDNK